MNNLKVPHRGIIYEFTGKKIFDTKIIRVVPSIRDHLVLVTPVSEVHKLIFRSDEESSMHSYDSLIKKGLLTPIPMPEKNAVDPTHYNQKGIQPIDYIMANGLGFNEGNVVKYVTRWKDKGGIEDLKKAIQYLEFEINFQETGKPRKTVLDTMSSRQRWEIFKGLGSGTIRFFKNLF